MAGGNGNRGDDYMRILNYYVYTNTDCTYYDSLDEAIEKYNSVEMKELRDCVFLGIQSDDISPTNGICFDVIHKFFNENILINDWRNHIDENDVKNAVKEIVNHFHISYQMSSDIFKGTCYSGVLIPFNSSWIRFGANEKMNNEWDEAYITSCNTNDFISIGWQPNNRQTRESYGWSYGEQACYIDRLNVEFIDLKGYVSHKDIDPREYLEYHGKKFTNYKELEG